MQIHIFRGQGRIFGFTEIDNGVNLPASYGPWTAFKSLIVTREVADPNFDTKECLDDVEQYGFHLTDAHKRFTEKAVG